MRVSGVIWGFQAIILLFMGIMEGNSALVEIMETEVFEERDD